MVKTLCCLFTNGNTIKLVRFGSNGAKSVTVSDRISKHIASKADTNFGLRYVEGYVLLDSWFED